MEFIFVKVRFGWGFAARLQPQSKMRMALKYPPPTTLIGALAYPWLRQTIGRTEVITKGKGVISAADNLRRMIAGVSSSLSEEPAVYGDYLKVNRYFRGSVESAVTALPSSFLYSNGDAEADLVYLFERPVDPGLERAAWGITRIGSRESVVSVESVYVGKAVRRTGSSTRTRFSFPLGNKVVRGSGTVIYAADWRSSAMGSYSKAERIPYFYPRGEVEVLGDLEWYELDLPWGTEVIIHS